MDEVGLHAVLGGCALNTVETIFSIILYAASVSYPNEGSTSFREIGRKRRHHCYVFCVPGFRQKVRRW